MDTPTTPSVSPAPALVPTSNNHILMGVLSYLGVLVIIPYLMAKDVPSVKFHIKQGIVLVLIEIVVWVISGIFWYFWFILQIIHLALITLSIIGIVNVVQNKEKELPITGPFAKYIHI